MIMVMWFKVVVLLKTAVIWDMEDHPLPLYSTSLKFMISKTFVEIVAPFLKGIVTLSLMEEDG